MRQKAIHWASAVAFAGTLFCAYGFSPVASARQAAQGAPAQQQSQQQPAAADKKPDAAPLQLDTPQGLTQRPAMQPSPLLQNRSQPPQLFGSLLVSVQILLQRTSPEGQGSTQALFTHVSPCGQQFPLQKTSGN